MKFNNLKLILLTLCSLSIILNAAFAEEIKIIATEDASVDEDLPNTNHESSPYLASGWTNKLSKENNEQETQQALTYIKFSLDELLELINNEKITIDTSKLIIWIENTLWNENDEHYIEIYPCFDNSWSEGNVTWNNSPCKEDLKKGIHYVLNESNIKNHSSFDVTDTIQNTVEQNISEITFILSVCSTGEGRIDCQKNPGLILMWPSENTNGSNVLPVLDIQYTKPLKESPPPWQVVTAIITISGGIITVIIKYVLNKKK